MTTLHSSLPIQSIGKSEFKRVWARLIADVLFSDSTVSDDGLQLRERLSVEYSFDASLVALSELEEIKNFANDAIRGGKGDKERPSIDYLGMLSAGGGSNGGLDGAIQKLRAKATTKKATICLQQNASVSPCLTALDFKLRDNRLRTVAFFRSQDVYRRFPANFAQLVEIARNVSDAVGVSCGEISVFVSSAHIYEVDFAAASRVLHDAADYRGLAVGSSRTVAIVGREKLYWSHPEHVQPLRMAFEVGLALGSRGWQILTGGLGGIMEAASAGARVAGGQVTGIIPHLTPEEREVRQINRFQQLAILSGLEQRARIPLIIDSAELTVAVNGGGGTRVEIERTLAQRKPVIVVAGSGGAADEYSNESKEGLHIARNAADVVALCASVRPNTKQEGHE